MAQCGGESQVAEYIEGGYNTNSPSQEESRDVKHSLCFPASDGGCLWSPSALAVLLVNLAFAPQHENKLKPTTLMNPRWRERSQLAPALEGPKLASCKISQDVRQKTQNFHESKNLAVWITMYPQCLEHR